MMPDEKMGKAKTSRISAAITGVLKFLSSPGANANRLANQWVAPLLFSIAIGIVVVIFYGNGQEERHVVIPVCLLIVGAACATGLFAGFLFGIPRSLQIESRSRSTNANVAETQSSYAVNTNLEQISDWLTKIIVGVGLVNLTDLPKFVSAGANYVASSFGTDKVPPSIIVLMATYFFIETFLLGYLWTRLYLAGEFSRAESEARAKPEFLEGMTHAHLYQPPPRGFMSAIEKGEEYRDKFGSIDSDRMWIYLACAYGQQYDYLNRSPIKDETALNEARKNALEAISRALQINPDARETLAALWDVKANSDEDDLKVFFNDPDFAEKLRPAGDEAAQPKL